MKRSLRYMIVGSVCAIALTSATLVSSQSSDTTPDHLRVVWTVNPESQALVGWTTQDEGTEHTIFWDVRSQDGDPASYSESAEVLENGQYGRSTDPLLPFFHHARLSDLEPDTEYFFVVSSDGDLSDERSFRTAHDDDREFKLLYGGDSRSNRTERQGMNERVRDLFEEDSDIFALVHGGDYIAHANSWPQWSEWLEDHEVITTAEGRILPIVPARGNHEGKGVLYNQVFGNPGGDSEINYYVSDFGPTRIITLDSEASQGGDQRDWLIEQLEDARDAKWVVAGYHRPAWPTVKSPAGAKEHWVPVFEQFNVDLVLESDGHALKRTPPIREDRIDYTGVVYVGEGGLGVRQRTPFEDRWYLQSPGMAMSAHHVQVLTFSDELIRYEAIMMDGLTADEITVPTREARLESKIAIAEVKATAPTRVEIIFTTPYETETVLDPENFTLTGDINVEFTVVGSEVASILRFVNTATLEELDDDARLDIRAARNIVAHREGEDERPGTADDNPFDTFEELDAIKFVGKTALERLGQFSTAQFEDQRNAVTLYVDELDVGQTYTLKINNVRSASGDTIADDTTASFTLASKDDRADSIEQPEEEQTPSGCSTTDAASPSFWFLLLGFLAMRRRKTS